MHRFIWNVVGGFGWASRIQQGYLSDLWKFDGTMWTWVSGANVTGDSEVPARYGTALFSIGNNIYMFGGRYGFLYIQYMYRDLRRFNGTHWSIIINNNETVGRSPSARYNPAYWTNGDDLFIFGGYGSSTNGAGFLSDYWRFRIGGSSWTYLGNPTASNTQGQYGTMGIFNTSSRFA